MIINLINKTKGPLKIQKYKKNLQANVKIQILTYTTMEIYNKHNEKQNILQSSWNERVTRYQNL